MLHDLGPKRKNWIQLEMHGLGALRANKAMNPYRLWCIHYLLRRGAMDGLSIADKLKAMHGTSKSSRRGRTTVSGTGLQTGATGDYSGAKEEQAGHERVIPPQLPK